MFNGSYKFDAYRFVCDGVFTTKTPTDAYRGAGRPEATFAIERIVDEMAAELGLDPMELRRKNWIKQDEFPFTTISGITYDSGNYEAATDKALQLMGWDDLRREQADRRARGDSVRLGLGISTFTELCGWAPSRLLGALRYAGGGWDHASVRVLPTGKVEVVTGTSPHGQGHETAWSQIVADRLGVPFDDVEVLHGDTQFSPRGWDTYGSRSVAVGAIAESNAALRVIDKAKRHRRAHARGQRGRRRVRRRDVQGARRARRRQDDPRRRVRRLRGPRHPRWRRAQPGRDATYDPEALSSRTAHICARSRSTRRPAGRRFAKDVCVDDVGEVINPLIVEGQVHGGVAQGIAQALYEEAVYDADGDLDNRHARRLSRAVGDGPAVVHDRPHGEPVYDESARRQGSRRDRHHRRDTGRR